MKRFALIAFVAFIFVSSSAARADLSPIEAGRPTSVGGVTYTLDDPAAVAAPSVWLSVTAARLEGEAIAEADGVPLNGAQLSGFWFDITARGADGRELAYPDPTDPTRPWRIPYGGVPVPVYLPDGPALYARQSGAPSGYEPFPGAIELTGRTPGSIIPVENALTGGLFTLRSVQAADYALAARDGSAAVRGSVSAGGSHSALLDVGQYILTITPAAGYLAPPQQAVEIRRGEAFAVQSDCAPLPRVSIRADAARFDGNGERVIVPMPGERITFTPAGGGQAVELVTDADGWARLAGEEGAPALQPGEYVMSSALEDARTVTLETSQTYERVILSHDGTGLVRVTADACETRDTVAPLEGGAFALRSESGDVYTLTTNADGSAWLAALPEGSYTLSTEYVPDGYTPLETSWPVTIRGGEESAVAARFTRDAQISARKLGRVPLASGAVETAALDSSFELYSADGIHMGALSGAAVPASPDGTVYVLMESSASSGFMPQREARLITAYPGDELSVDVYVDSELGLFRVIHGAQGAVFRLEALNTDAALSMTLTSDADGIAAPDAPLAPGGYRITLIKAAEGMIADPSVSPVTMDVTLSSWLDGDGAPRGSGGEFTFRAASAPASVEAPAPPVISAPADEISRTEESLVRAEVAPVYTGYPIMGARVDIQISEETGVSLASLRVPAARGGTGDTASVAVKADGEWLELGSVPLPYETAWDDIYVRVTEVRVSLGAESEPGDIADGAPDTFTLPSGWAVECGVRILPKYAGDSSLVITAESSALTPFRTGEDTRRAFESRAQASAAIPLRAAGLPANGAVYEDADGDGKRGGGERGITFARVAAINASGRVIGESVTDADGAFHIDAIDAADFTVSFEELHERTARRFVAGERDGYIIPAMPESSLAVEITGAAEFDEAAQRAPAILTLSRDGSAAASIEISGRGVYKVDGLSSGPYDLAITLPEGFVTDRAPEPVTLPYGGAGSAVIGIRRAASVSGGVSVDASDSGADKAIIGGVRFTLYGADGKAAYEAAVSPDGSFELNTVTPGAYTARWDIPGGISPGPNQRVSVGLDLAEGRRETIALTVTRSSVILGRAYDHAGSALPGIAVTARSESGAAYEAVTDDGGAYAFADVPPGLYAVEPALPTGTVIYEGGTEAEALPGGETVLDWMIFKPSRMEGLMWIDADGDGTYRSRADMPLAGVRLTLTDSSGPAAAAAVSGADGAFTMERLRPGDYMLAAELPEGMLFAGVPDGWTTDGRRASARVSLAPGGTYSDAMPGAVVSGKISGGVWQDLNGDGVRDQVEPPVAGTEVLLARGGASAVAVSTDISGSFAFGNIPPGDYEIIISVPDGLSAPDGGGRQARVSVSVSPGDGASAPAFIGMPLAPVTSVPGFARLADGSPLRGVRVSLITTAGETAGEAATDSSGMFRLEGVRAGSYTLRFDLPDETLGAFAFEHTDERYTESTISVRGGAPENYPAPTAVRLSAVDGMVFADDNGDGVINGGERGLAGAVMRISLNGQTVREAESGEDGRFSFKNVRPGIYAIGGSLPDGWSWRGGESEWVVSLTAGTAFDYGSLAAFRAGSAEGFVRVDKNGDGKLDNAPPLEGVTVTLTRGALEYGSVVTGADGRYFFDALQAGDYTLVFQLPEGMLFSEAGLLAGAKGSAAASAPIPVRMGEKSRPDAVGAVYGCDISGRAWLDTVYNGLFDTAETALPGVLVTLLDASGQTAAQAQTGEDGAYRISAARPGEYRLHFALPDGLIFTKPAQGGSVAPASNARQAFSEMFRINPGESLADMGAGAIWPVLLSGEIFTDSNADGVRDAGEPPLGGIRVTARAEDGAETTVVSGADGRFKFDTLRPGGYEIIYNWPDGMIATAEGGGLMTLAVGEDRSDERAGATPAASILCVAFEDVDSDGYFSQTDHILEGVRVTLSGPWGDEAGVTGPDGGALFTRLKPGTYSATFEMPEGYMFTRRRPDGSMTESTDGNVSGTGTFDLPMGGDKVVYAGAVRAGSIGDYAWLDENFNGLQDDSEPGLAGVVISLERLDDGAWSETARTLTDEYGYYEFTAVRPGTYRLIAQTPEGSRALYPAQPVSLSEINSKLTFRTGDTLASEPFLLGSAERIRNQDLGLVDADHAQARGWTVSASGALNAGGQTRAEEEPEAVPAIAAAHQSESLPVEILGMVWRDDDGSGVYDPGEPLVEFAEIAIFREILSVIETSSDVETSVVTDANGAFGFEVGAGETIRLVVKLPAGLIFQDGKDVREVEIHIGPDEAAVRVDLPTYMP